MQPLSSESEKRGREGETPATSVTTPAPKRQRLKPNEVDRTDYKAVCLVAGCGAKFKKPSKLLAHARVHNKPPREEWQHVCAEEKCEKRFLTAGGLNFHHRNVHHKNVHAEKLLACKEIDCGKTFAIASALASHQLVHTEERPVACEVKGCDKSFKTRAKLTQHMVFHSDERPYACVVVDCDARFKRAQNLASHQRSAHSDARPFKCTVAGCERAVKSQSELRIHMFTHDAELPCKCEHEEYACPDSRCRGATFDTVEGFTKHVNDLHVLNPLKAEYLKSGGISCAFASTNSCGLARHVKQMHDNAQSRVDSLRETRFKSALKAAGFSYERTVQINFSCFKTEGRYARIDFQVYGRADGAIVIVEVDQYQHRNRQQYSQACERRRLLDVVTALQTNERFAGARILWIRYNPDPYTYNKKRVTKSIGTREEEMVRVIRDMALPADGRLLTLLYMYYDSVTDPATGKPQACVLLDDEEVPEMLYDCAIPAIV